MAKAQFHKNQRVYVKPVGTWSTIERIMPQWTKGLDEPIRIFYDVGLGREFSAEELKAEQAQAESIAQIPHETWRIVRARNKWQSAEDCSHHPFPGTYPVVMTGEKDWGGWRVPGAEYDHDPSRIETQARLISAAPKLFALAEAVAKFVAEGHENVPAEFLGIARDVTEVLRYVKQTDSR